MFSIACLKNQSAIEHYGYLVLTLPTNIDRESSSSRFSCEAAVLAGSSNPMIGKKGSN